MSLPFLSLPAVVSLVVVASFCAAAAQYEATEDVADAEQIAHVSIPNRSQPVSFALLASRASWGRRGNPRFRTGTCATFGCGDFSIPWHSCQCHLGCTNCCHDYLSLCKVSPKALSQPAPAFNAKPRVAVGGVRAKPAPTSLRQGGAPPQQDGIGDDFDDYEDDGDLVIPVHEDVVPSLPEAASPSPDSKHADGPAHHHDAPGAQQQASQEEPKTIHEAVQMHAEGHAHHKSKAAQLPNFQKERERVHGHEHTHAQQGHVHAHHHTSKVTPLPLDSKNGHAEGHVHHHKAKAQQHPSDSEPGRIHENARLHVEGGHHSAHHRTVSTPLQRPLPTDHEKIYLDEEAHLDKPPQKSKRHQSSKSDAQTKELRVERHHARRKHHHPRQPLLDDDDEPEKIFVEEEGHHAAHEKKSGTQSKARQPSDQQHHDHSHGADVAKLQKNHAHGTGHFKKHDQTSTKKSAAHSSHHENADSPAHQGRKRPVGAIEDNNVSRHPSRLRRSDSHHHEGHRHHHSKEPVEEEKDLDEVGLI